MRKQNSHQQKNTRHRYLIHKVAYNCAIDKTVAPTTVLPCHGNTTVPTNKTGYRWKPTHSTKTLHITFSSSMVHMSMSLIPGLMKLWA